MSQTVLEPKIASEFQIRPRARASTASKRIVELDCIRGLTAFLVVIFHFTKGTPYRAYVDLFSSGTDLFFIISGFVGYNLVTARPTVSDYFKKRFLRLVPTFWLCVSITFLMFLVYRINYGMPLGSLLVQYLTNLTFVNYYLKIPYLDGVYWTLLIEVLFYVAMGAALFLGWVKQLEWIGAAVLLYLFVASAVPLGWFGKVHWQLMGYFPLLPVWPAFYAGIIFNKLKYHGATRLRWLLLSFCFFTTLAVFQHYTRKYHAQNLLMPEHVAMTGLYYAVFYLAINKGLAFITNKAMLYLASVSYCLYLIHNVMGSFFLKPYLHALPMLLQVVLMTATAIGVSSFLTFLVEKPVLLGVKRLFWRRRYARGA
ncbi:acyltransferase family protein [Rufibacter psychrotolerans]|uniref:acyltransferase family protein n=1 Tax=Rufibacter psychrotolerans TaxID=2812556 RepID=UPI001968A1B2|nr:acyltransferase [Rufibacter sp. SYSU D00308]